MWKPNPKYENSAYAEVMKGEAVLSNTSEALKEKSGGANFIWRGTHKEPPHEISFEKKREECLEQEWDVGTPSLSYRSKDRDV